MTATLTTVAERAARAKRQRAARLGIADVVLLAISCVVAFAIVLTYAGRFAALDRSERARRGTPIDLNSIDGAELLEPGLTAAFPHVDDRQFAAREWFRVLIAERQNGRQVLNVGAVSAATVPADAIRRNPRLDSFARRLTASRDAAAAAGRPTPESLPLFTAADVAAIKPSFVVRTRTAFRNQVVFWSLLYLLGFHIVSAIWRRRGIDAERFLLAVAHLITGIGFVILLSRPDPLRDVALFVRYSEGVLAGLGLMLVCSVIDFGTTAFRDLSYVPLLAAVALCVLLIVFGHGPGRSGAKVNLGPFQPIEAIRLLLAFFLAGYFARRWELLRGIRSRAIRSVQLPEWMNVPRAEYVLPVIGGVGVALALFAVQKDLGPALLLCCVFLTMYAVARGRIVMPIAGLFLLVAGFYLSHLAHVSRTLSDRVVMWQSPWNNSAAGGDQVAHAVWAMAAGGPAGTGVGLGDSRYLPAGYTDLVLAAVGEELGIVGWIVLAALYGALAWRGFGIAKSASSDYGFFLSTALTLFLIVPALVMAAGMVGAIPLTGVVTPFLSYGGSAMAANFAALGILSSIDADRRRSADLQPFVAPLRWVAGTLAIAAVVVIGMVADIQVVRADEYVVRPYLGVQADGGRRYAYNPRILDVARQFRRGTIFDRRDLPLATDDGDIAAKARAEYDKLGVRLGEACPSLSDRCYPLGGRAFHVLGDATTRVNWGAPNTSFVERDAEATLRGFDDHASVVATTDESGRAMSTIRRDYGEIVPLLRHKYQPTHAAVIALDRRTRDVRLTLDAALQIRVASIIEAHARQTSGKAAAVVLDPDSGAVLASVSYPWPAADATFDDSDRGVDALLDRARYGLYTPGSTFKLVTAAAALDRSLDLAKTVFSCTRLADGRVGATLPGWSRPVRDDVLDAHPHGTIDMHAGLVHSCNAYFAQLALKVGAQPLVDCATRLGIALTPASHSTDRVRDMLPQVGYGQADVRATPLRMARLAAAIAAAGTLRDARWDRTAGLAGRAFIAPAAARLLAAYMRDAVVSGTGSSLRNNSWRIAGKTGTAEVSGGPSHAWFVGYAPHGTARKRIAFAIIVENGGYGGRTAAPIAGEIVSAAALSGLIE